MWNLPPRPVTSCLEPTAVCCALNFPPSFVIIPMCRIPWFLLSIHFLPILQTCLKSFFHSQPLWPTLSPSLSTISFHQPTLTIPYSYPFISSILTIDKHFGFLIVSSSNPAGTIELLGPVPCYFLCLGLCPSGLAPLNTSLTPLCLKC